MRTRLRSCSATLVPTSVAIQDAENSAILRIVALENLFQDERLQDFKGKISITYDSGSVKVDGGASSKNVALEEQVKDLELEVERLQEDYYDLEDTNEDLVDENRALKRALSEIARTAEEAGY